MKRSHQKKTKLRWQPLLLSTILFIFLLGFTLHFVGLKKGQWEENVRNELFQTLVTKKTKLEKSLYSRIYYTKSVAAYVSLRPNLSNSEFYNLAEELIQEDTVISTMALSPNCVIAALYPLEGHEAAIGLDLLAHEQRREIVNQTIETHLSFVAGPVELVEGDTAFISYTPIFDKSDSEKEKFWGVTDIVIYRDKLFAEVGLVPEENGDLFSMRGYDGTGKDGAIFWGHPKVFTSTPVTVTVSLPYGEWILAACPKRGWKSFLDQDNFLFAILLITSLIISLLVGFLFRAWLRIKKNEQQLSAVFQSLDSLVIEFDQDGKYLDIITTNQNLLFQPREEMLGQTVFEIFDSQTAEAFHGAIQKCLLSKKLVLLEYPLQIDGHDKWFTARITKKSEKSVIFHAFDHTEYKKQQQALLTSETSLRSLNSTKDKLFSILSHDLRSPFNALLGLTEILDEQMEDLSPEQVRKIHKKLRKTSNETYNLLSNLLSWSLAQRGQISLSIKGLLLKELCDLAIADTASQAKEKDISIQVDISSSLSINGDQDTLRLVLRNLISNGIKFSNIGSSIQIEGSKNEKGTLLKIQDHGIGISENQLENLFTLNPERKQLGTSDEKGTGLGLMLCKEFLDLNNANIVVNSTVGTGTKVELCFLPFVKN